MSSTPWPRIAAFVLVALGCTAAPADEVADKALARCAVIGAPTDRLACYDALAGRAQAPLAPPPAASGPAPTTLLAPKEPVSAVPLNEGGESLMSKYWELDARDKRGIFNFTGFHPNFVLPVHVASDINRTPHSPTQATVTTPDYSHTEGKIQLSLRTKLLQDVLLPGADLWAGYTQQSLWQVYNAADSRPFRNTDYQPELMVVVPAPEGLRPLPWGWQWRFGQLGIVHESNGQSDPLSRSWNRVYLGAGFERGDVGLTAHVWKRLSEDPDNDNNPDITSYVGRGDLQLTWTPGRATASLLVRSPLKTLNRGSAQFELTYPVYRDQPNGLRWFLQVFSGYGETLTDYNFRQTSVGAGVTFLQF
ncbi:MAG: phospholipase A [Proteobacteria bacterium]|nr:phospholipase A [Pseudomonadota bacterium]